MLLAGFILGCDVQILQMSPMRVLYYVEACQQCLLVIQCVDTKENHD